ncbi:glutamyl-tRNA reductase [Chlamydia sp.]|uniref:glutamyl-tRNA reductase n=1 Tax=Chlamydia sp. TaxID=35827 RepID=UPI0025C07BBF|nr:glutamyl-tRNA reductase [Chlamydia sp.]MBQ8498842.1 glutamyl-tRNA reductase [Chlamydia sp.]
MRTKLSLGVIGVSYRETPLQQREQVLQILQQAQVSLDQDPFLEEGNYVLLSTCHRVELYGIATDELFFALKKDMLALGATPYFYRNHECFSHLFCVAGGLDSLVLGETEIQGQVRRAYLQAAGERKLSFILHFLFQKALKEGKSFRAKGCAPRSGITISTFVNQELQKRKIALNSALLFMGYSEINRMVAHDLQKQGFSCLTFCSRQELPMLLAHQVLREEVSFRDPYQVVFLGSSELLRTPPYPNWEQIWDFPERVVFDFAVPRALSAQAAFCHNYIDMEQISEWLRQHQLQVSVTQLQSLQEGAYRCWESLDRRLERRFCVAPHA